MEEMPLLNEQMNEQVNDAAAEINQSIKRS